MPIYEYRCWNCHRVFEELLLQGEDDIGIKKCPTCGAYGNKLMSSSSFRLYGDGFYKQHNRGEFGENDKPSERKTKTVKKKETP